MNTVMKKSLKYLFTALIGLLAITVVAIPLIPAEHYRPEIENQISQALGVQTSVGDISLVSLPTPGITVENIQLSSEGNSLVMIENISIFPRLSSLFSSQTEIRKIHLSGIRMEAADLHPLANLMQQHTNATTSSHNIRVNRITADDASIVFGKSEQVGPIRFKAILSSSGSLEQLEMALQENAVKLSISPEQEYLAIDLQANNWTSFLEHRLVLDHLKASGKLSQSKIHFDNIKARAYKGKLAGNLILDWADQWKLDSRVTLDGLDTKLFLEALNNDSLDGTASARYRLRSSAASIGELADNFHIIGEAKIINGHIYDTDLEQAARSLSSDWISGGQTPFDEFSTHLDIKRTKVRLTNMYVKSSLLTATGKLKITSFSDLDGELSVGVDDPTGMVNMPLLVAGTLDKPRVRPTDEALAGAAVGTAILGPGVGTAVGVKAGEFIGKIGSLFGGDEDTPEKQSE